MDLQIKSDAHASLNTTVENFGIRDIFLHVLSNIVNQSSKMEKHTQN